MFRFTIRDLLWLMVVVGLVCGWWMHYRKLTQPPKLYRDSEAERLSTDLGLIVDDSEWPFRLVVPVGKSMPLSQVLKTLGIDPRRLTDFRYYGGGGRGIGLYWQLTPRYDLYCATSADDKALAWDDPNRQIYVVEIHDREQPKPAATLPPGGDELERGDIKAGVEL